MITGIHILYKCDDCDKPEAVMSDRNFTTKLPVNWTRIEKDRRLKRQHRCWDCSDKHALELEKKNEKHGN